MLNPNSKNIFKVMFFVSLLLAGGATTKTIVPEDSEQVELQDELVDESLSSLSTYESNQTEETLETDTDAEAKEEYLVEEQEFAEATPIDDTEIVENKVENQALLQEPFFNKIKTVSSHATKTVLKLPNLTKIIIGGGVVTLVGIVAIVATCLGLKKGKNEKPNNNKKVKFNEKELEVVVEEIVKEDNVISEYDDHSEQESVDENPKDELSDEEGDLLEALTHLDEAERNEVIGLRRNILSNSEDAATCVDKIIKIVYGPLNAPTPLEEEISELQAEGNKQIIEEITLEILQTKNNILNQIPKGNYFDKDIKNYLEKIELYQEDIFGKKSLVFFWKIENAALGIDNYFPTIRQSIIRSHRSFYLYRFINGKTVDKSWS